MTRRGRHDELDRTAVERHDPLLGRVVGEIADNQYRLLEKIAAGGFGAIYRGKHLTTGLDVAVKVLHPSHAADRNVIARFRREGTMLSSLRAPHTVTTYEFGEAADGMLYIVMELLRGVSLHERLRARGALPWRDALLIARAICSSLAEAHALGIIHRDLKPANVQLEPRPGSTDFVKVLDFGIAKIRRDTRIDDGNDLTTAGQMIGTIDYMSPEQILGATCDGRSDLFTVGIVLYEMIAGRRPFADSATPTSMLAALLTQTAPPLSSWVEVSPALDELVQRCLHREPVDRFASVADLIAAIDSVLGAVDEESETRLLDVAALREATPAPVVDEDATIAAPLLDEDATIAAEMFASIEAALRPSVASSVASSVTSSVASSVASPSSGPPVDPVPTAAPVPRKSTRTIGGYTPAPVRRATTGEPRGPTPLAAPPA
ncbi:MAG: serine/threonine protein kinase, partial [Myxococcota bacterium]|nr:serine/threonine protein kinase [Myxococcota bacterium]